MRLSITKRAFLILLAFTPHATLANDSYIIREKRVRGEDRAYATPEKFHNARKAGSSSSVGAKSLRKSGASRKIMNSRPQSSGTSSMDTNSDGAPSFVESSMDMDDTTSTGSAKSSYSSMNNAIKGSAKSSYSSMHNTDNANKGSAKSSYSSTDDAETNANKGSAKSSYTSMDDTVSANKGSAQSSYSSTDNTNQGSAKSSYTSMDSTNEGSQKSSYSSTKNAIKGSAKSVYTSTDNANKGSAKSAGSYKSSSANKSSKYMSSNKSASRSFISKKSMTQSMRMSMLASRSASRSAGQSSSQDFAPPYDSNSGDENLPTPETPTTPPTISPIATTVSPTAMPVSTPEPTAKASEIVPTVAPVTASPTSAPVAATAEPTVSPTLQPTPMVTSSPTLVPTTPPVPDPTPPPTPNPTIPPTPNPTVPPTPIPTVPPTPIPTVPPTPIPTVPPTPNPTAVATPRPTPVPTAASGYDIELSYATNVPTTLQGQVRAAADRLEEIIIGDLSPQSGAVIPEDYQCTTAPDVIDDMWICAQVAELPQFVDGQGGFDMVRIGENDLPFMGFITISSEVPDPNIAVLIHEMMHSIGFGTLWTRRGLLTGESPSCSYGIDLAATREYQAISGCSAAEIPISQGNQFPDCQHWDETCFVHEIMSPTYLLNNDGSVPYQLSRITVATMEDIGYTVNLNAADPYTTANMDSSCVCNNGRHADREEELPALSNELHQQATAYGKRVLKRKHQDRQRRLQQNPGLHNEERHLGGVYVGDQVMYLLVRENNALHTVIVTQSYD